VARRDCSLFRADPTAVDEDADWRVDQLSAVVVDMASTLLLADAVLW